MKNLIQTFKRSLYDPAFYRTVASAPLGDAFRYYAKIALVFSVLTTIMFSVFLVPTGIAFIKSATPEFVKTYYPHGLVVTVKHNEVSVNVPEPYVIPAQGELKRALSSAASPVQNVLVIDTRSDFNRKAFDEHKTLMLITKHEVVAQSDNGRITIQDVRNVPDVVISEEVVTNWINEVIGSLGTFVPIGIAFIFVFLLLDFLVSLIPLLLFAFVPLLIAWIKKAPLSYASAYRMSLYAIVPALAFRMLLNSVGIFTAPAYLTFLVFLLIIMLNMRDDGQPKLFNS